MALRRSVPFCLVMTGALWGVAQVIQPGDPASRAALTTTRHEVQPFQPASLPEVPTGPSRPVRISADNTVAPEQILNPPPHVFAVRSLRTLRAGVFQMPVLSPRDLAVGPLAIVPTPASLHMPDPLAPEQDPELEAALAGDAIHGQMKANATKWPVVDRTRKGDLDLSGLPEGVDVAPPKLRGPQSRIAPIELPVPFERGEGSTQSAIASPADGASPAAAMPAMAGIDQRTTVAVTEAPLEVEAAPVAGDPGLTPPSTVAVEEPLPETDEGVTTVIRHVGLDDGIARPLDLPPVAYTRAQTCLAEAVYHEARGESENGQIAVAQVVINRVRSIYYPNDVCGVVYQNSWRRNACQFSFACDGISDRIDEPGPWKQALSIAQRVMDGEAWLPEVGNATHYHATYVSPRWVRDMVEKDRIGRHVFYRVRWWG